MTRSLTHTDLLTLRRLCRRHDDVRANAALLFAEVCDATELKKGCIKSNECLATELGCTVKSIRNWLSELEEVGFITESKQGGKRLLAPAVPNALRNEFSETESSFRKDASETERCFRNGKDIRNDASAENGKDFPTQRVNTPAEARERAPAREDSDSGKLFERIVEVYRDVQGGLTPREEQKLIRLCRQIGDEYDPSTVASALREDLLGADRWSAGVFLDSVLPKYVRGDPGGATGGDGMPTQHFTDNTGEGYHSFCPEYQINGSA